MGLSLALALFSLAETFALAQKLGVAPFKSKTTLALIVFWGLAAGLSALGWRFQPEKWQFPRWPRPARIPLLAALAGLAVSFPWLMAQPVVSNLIGASPATRFFVFWLLGLMSALLLKLGWPGLRGAAALAASLFVLSTVNLLAGSLPALTDYPFALGWSETSRFYFPSLFFSELLYGQRYPWPILHPSLHLLLSLPYLFNAPLWAHRAWQVGLRLLMTALIPAALLSRFQLRSRGWAWLTGLWVFIFLMDVSIYLHLPLMVFPLLWLYRPRSPRRAWLLLLAASVWAGLSRINWYPMPGLILSVLWLEEEGPERLSPRSLLFPAALVSVGTLTAFAAARGYILLSGADAENFFTSLSSDLLWYRLWPNPTYPLGVLPGIAALSLPLWLVLLLGKRPGWPLMTILAALLAGGLLVSLKIGGGADLHNLDAYAVMLVIVAAYAFFRRPRPLPWQALGLLMLIPAWFAQSGGSGLTRYDPQMSAETLQALQRRVDSTSGEMLFITQRHLLSMRLLQGVTLLPEYEREDLMEMAMAHNTLYLERFARDVESQRFAMIVVDPLKFNLLGSAYPMGEENNAWARAAARPILCWYEPAESFPQDKIVIYTPRKSGKSCP